MDTGKVIKAVVVAAVVALAGVLTEEFASKPFNNE